MPVAEHSLSMFLQHSGEVMPEIERGEVRLQRRDGPDLVVMTAEQAWAVEMVLRMFAQPEHPTVVLPWLKFLGDDGIEACLSDLRDVALAAVDTGELQRVSDRVYSWKATALACWDELMLGRSPNYTEYLEEAPTPLPRPA